jgi:multidrug efflux pump subunit AcrA (membrane-fusion protein)
MRKLLIRSIVPLLLVAAGYAAYRVYQALPQRTETLATTKVKQGDVVVRSYTRGELRAVRSATLTAPNLFGTVQVTKLATLGSLAREKDLVVEFDDAEVLSRLEEKQLELDQIDEQVKKAQADLAIRDNQDQVELLRARYSVRRAELEVKRNELISAIDARKNLLTLEESKRRLTQLESDIKSRREQAQAELAVLQEKKNKANLELSREKQRLAQVKLLAPMSGLVAIKQNRSTVMMFGMQLPDIREGDQVQPGMPVADILDLSEMEVVAKVGELDRANLTEGQEVSMRLDAVPDKSFTGRIKSMSGTASANMFSADPAKKFDVIFSIDMQQLLKALGASDAAIRLVTAQAEANRKKAPMASAPLGPEAMAAMKAGNNNRGPRVPNLPQMFNVGGMMVSQKDLDNAKLPPPPEEDNQLNILLRPGLLADVEIIVEKVPNAIHVPIQAVFEKEGKQVVFVKTANGFESRPIKPLKRSENVMIISSGVKPGETIALANPEAKPGDKKKDDNKGGAAAVLPGGKGGN